MKRKYLKVENNEEIIIINQNKPTISIKNNNNCISISEINSRNKENTNVISITDIEYNKLVDFILTKLLESNNNNKRDDTINKRLEQHYKLLCQNNYMSEDIQDIKFQCITFYNQ